MMARRARMLALLQLSALMFLLVAELVHAAPVSNNSSINTIHDDGVFLEKHDDVHSVASSEDKPGDSEAESGHHTTATQDVHNMSNVDIQEDFMVTKGIDDATNVESGEENKKDAASMLTKSEEEAGEESEEVSEEKVDKNKDSSIKSEEDVGVADGSSAESEANVDKLKDTPVTKSGENGKTTESGNAAFEESAEKHEDHTSLENEEVKSAGGTNDAVSEESMEKNEDPMTTKTGENTSDAESKENTEKVDGPTGKDASTPGDNEEGLEENTGKNEDKATESEPSKEQLGTAVAGDVNNEDSKEFTDTLKDKKDAVESSLSNKGSEENKEDDTSEDEVSEESNKEMEGKHGAAMENSSEETSDAEIEVGDIEVNENHSSTHQESHVTSSPFGRLSLPSSDNHHIEEDEQHGNKDVAMEGHESNPSVEETAENEAGSPDELIENDKVDSEVIKHDNKTAALGKNMPITKAEEDAQKKDESSQDTSKDSETPVVMGGKLLEEVNEKDNFLDKDDMDSEAHLAHSVEKNEDVLVVSEETFNIENPTEDPSEDEGSGTAPDTKLSKESGHHTDESGDSGSGDDEIEHTPFGKQANNRTDDVEDGAASESSPLSGHYDDMTSEEHTTKSNAYSDVPLVPIAGDKEGSSAEYTSVSPTPENESSTKTASFEETNDQNENGDQLKEENLAQNQSNVQVMSLNPTTPVPDEADNQHAAFDGSGDDDTTTPVAMIILDDIIDDSMAVSSKEIDLVNSSVIGEASPAYQEKPAEKVILTQLAGAPLSTTTEPPCIADEENDCLLQSNKTDENAGVNNILEDDDEVPPEPTKGVIYTKSTSDDDLKELEVIISTTPTVKVSSEEEFLQRSISVELNQPVLHSNEEISSTTLAPEVQEITEPIVDHEDVENEAINISAPDTIVKHPLDESGNKEMSGKIRAANVNELGVSGQENSDDLGEPEALDSSSASGSYVVLGCIMAVVVVLLAYAAIKSRRERGTNTNSKKQSEVAGDDDDGTELKDMKKALLPPETPHDDCNGDIEANRKPLMNKDVNQEEDEEKEPIIKQNGTLEKSEPPRDIESQVDSSTAENQLKTAPTPNKPQQRNGLSEVVVEKPAISNGKADSIITHPVAAKVKVIENEDSIAKTPVIINRGGSSPPH